MTADPANRCRVCGARLTVDGAACGVCGFRYLGTGATRYDYDAEYDEKSDYNSQAPDQVLEHYRRSPNTGWALDRLASLRRDEGFGTLFEFGASQGAFLALAESVGYRVRGVELATASIVYGRTRLGLGERLEHGVWRARSDDEAAVDAVCAFEVLEHSEAPIEFLGMMRSWVRPGGAIFISVPNGRRLSVRVGRREPQDYPPHHLMYWTTRSLELAALRVGFKPVEVKTSALTHSDLLRLAAPRVAERRAADVGAFRPIGSASTSRGLPSLLRLVYPAFIVAGRATATAINLVPELGQRLMLMARA